MTVFLTKPARRIILIIFFLGACSPLSREKDSGSAPPVWYDSHVHMMSPDLIADWKALGIPFSKPASYYSNIDTLLKRGQAENIDLIGMGYVYESPDFYQGEDRYERLKKENDYLLATAQKHPDRIRPFFTVDPLKEYALDEFNRCIDRHPGSGLKLHFNASQVYLTEPTHLAKVKPLFRLAAEKKAPVLLHFDNSHPKFGVPDVQLFVDSILKVLPALNINIAHFGTSGGFNEKTRTVLDAFIGQYQKGQIPSRHQLFFDLSAVALNKDSDGVPKLTPSEFKELGSYIRKLGVKKVVFGTDYPLYTSEEYFQILINEVGLTSEEWDIIQKNTQLYSNKKHEISNPVSGH